ncbi:MAG: hypothetical protein ACOWW1_07420 [archaeon]
MFIAISSNTAGNEPEKDSYIIEIRTSESHHGVVLVENENSTVYYKKFEHDDEATVTREYQFEAQVGDKVTVEVQFGGIVRVRLVKEGVLIDKTIASKTDFDGVVFKYTIEDDNE